MEKWVRELDPKGLLTSWLLMSHILTIAWPLAMCDSILPTFLLQLKQVGKSWV